MVARVTTAQAIDEERALVALAERGRGRGPCYPGSGAGRLLASARISCASCGTSWRAPDRLLAVEGKAGTGKTRALSVVRERAEQAGFKVRGFAPRRPRPSAC